MNDKKEESICTNCKNCMIRTGKKTCSNLDLARYTRIEQNHICLILNEEIEVEVTSCSKFKRKIKKQKKEEIVKDKIDKDIYIHNFLKKWGIEKPIKDKVLINEFDENGNYNEISYIGLCNMMNEWKENN